MKNNCPKIIQVNIYVDPDDDKKCHPECEWLGNSGNGFWCDLFGETLDKNSRVYLCGALDPEINNLDIKHTDKLGADEKWIIPGK